MLNKLKIITVLLLAFNTLCSQENQTISQLTKEISNLEQKKDSLLNELEFLILKEDLTEIIKTIIPSKKDITKHHALVISYNEEHEQANWVAHKINKKIIDGNVSRTNNFRVDSQIKSGSSEEKDYFLKTKLPSGKYTYDGFGYDRGHLAPSADFKWSKTALSDSYYYSNMSPQLPEFNRKGWANIEGFLRNYVYENETDLLVVTGPFYNENVNKSERSINNMSIPDYFFKVAVDLKNMLGVGFRVPHKKLTSPIESYMVSIDSIEAFTGYDFNFQLPDLIENKLEKEMEVKSWQNKKNRGNVAPIDSKKLPKGAFNTVQAGQFSDEGKKVTICGKVVSTKLSKNGHTFLNLDQAFPNQIFSATIWKSNSIHFSFPPHIKLKDKYVCLEGKITDNKGTPTMDLTNEKNISYVDL